jgi:hypothetical protein
MFSKRISPAALTVSLAVFFAAFGWLGASAAYAACGVPRHVAQPPPHTQTVRLTCRGI